MVDGENGLVGIYPASRETERCNRSNVISTLLSMG